MVRRSRHLTSRPSSLCRVSFLSGTWSHPRGRQHGAAVRPGLGCLGGGAGARGRENPSGRIPALFPQASFRASCSSKVEPTQQMEMRLQPGKRVTRLGTLWRRRDPQPQGTVRPRLPWVPGPSRWYCTWGRGSPGHVPTHRVPTHRDPTHHVRAQQAGLPSATFGPFLVSSVSCPDPWGADTTPSLGRPACAPVGQGQSSTEGQAVCEESVDSRLQGGTPAGRDGPPGGALHPGAGLAVSRAASGARPTVVSSVDLLPTLSWCLEGKDSPLRCRAPSDLTRGALRRRLHDLCSLGRQGARPPGRSDPHHPQSSGQGVILTSTGSSVSQCSCKGLSQASPIWRLILCHKTGNHQVPQD